MNLDQLKQAMKIKDQVAKPCSPPSQPVRLGEMPMPNVWIEETESGLARYMIMTEDGRAVPLDDW